ncbi:MAG: hypothetical protein IT547_12625 [Hyphomonadaceae bacterium]|jgi:hypothetical protein|nr:hypothetical protein [Hyphomonadaceae bacterium]
MTEITLGDVLALSQQSSAQLNAWLHAADPEAAQRLGEEAARREESPAQFLRIAVSDFISEADEEAWASLLSAARDAGDPGAVCAARMIAFRLKLESVS